MVRELRSCKLHSAARKKRKKTSSSQEEETTRSKALRRHLLAGNEASAGSVVSKEVVRKAALWFSIMCDGNLLEGFKKRNDVGRHRSTELIWRLPWWSNGYNSALPRQGARVPSLVGKLHPTCRTTNNVHAQQRLKIPCAVLLIVLIITL